MINEIEKSLTVILAHRGVNAERGDNLRFTLARHRRLLPSARFIVAEQDTEDGPWEGTERLAWSSRDGVFCKGKCLNMAAAAARSEWLMLLDGDAQVDPGILRNLDEFLRAGRPAFPFNQARFLTPEETRDTLASGEIPPLRDPGRLVRSHVSLALFVPRKVYHRAGGVEELKGWGWQDVLFWHKVKSLCGPFARPRGGATRITHLWHPPSGTPEWKTTERYRINLAEWTRVRRMPREALREHVRTRRAEFEAAYGPFAGEA